MSRTQRKLLKMDQFSKQTINTWFSNILLYLTKLSNIDKKFTVKMKKCGFTFITVFSKFISLKRTNLFSNHRYHRKMNEGWWMLILTTYSYFTDKYNERWKHEISIKRFSFACFGHMNIYSDTYKVVISV